MYNDDQKNTFAFLDIPNYMLYFHNLKNLINDRSDKYVISNL